MRLPTIFFILCIFVSGTIWAQPNSYKLIGTLKTDSDQLVPIKLNITVNEDGYISGNSITNFYSEHKTESRIEGRLDFKKHLLTFSEVSNINTSSDARANEFCYIRVNNLPWKQSQEKTIFNGSFNGYYPDSSACASGEIYLVSMDLLKEMVAKNKKLTQIKDSLKQHYHESPTPKEDRVILKQIDPESPLMHQSELSLAWSANEIKVNVWDSYEEDNDRFDIYVNDSLVHNSVVATAHKKSFRFNFSGNSCTIKIVAENEGRRPPNTFNAELIDNGKVHPLKTKLNKGEFVEFKLIKTKS